MNSEPSIKSADVNGAALVLLARIALFAGSTVHGKSVTMDEVAHLGAGVTTRTCCAYGIQSSRIARSLSSLVGFFPVFIASRNCPSIFAANSGSFSGCRSNHRDITRTSVGKPTNSR